MIQPLSAVVTLDLPDHVPPAQFVFYTISDCLAAILIALGQVGLGRWFTGATLTAGPGGGGGLEV